MKKIWMRNLCLLSFLILLFTACPYKGSHTEAEQQELDSESLDSQSKTEESPMSVLVSAIREANRDLPEAIDESITLDKVILEGNYAVYYYTLDEDNYSVDDFRDKKRELKKAIKDQLLNSTDSDVQSFLSLCKSCGKGIANRYVGARSNDTCTVYVDSSEF